MLRGQIGRGMIEGQEFKKSNCNGNPDMAFGKEQSLSSRASRMVVYPMKDPKTSGKASGSGEPPKPFHSSVSSDRANSNYTMDIKIAKELAPRGAWLRQISCQEISCSAVALLILRKCVSSDAR